MDSIKLMNRVDTKYVTDRARLEEILRRAAGDYYVLVSDGGRIAPYTSLYYDTEDRNMYHVHQSGKLTRRKVRTRTYLGSGTTFLEVKRKNNHKRTKKKRIEIPREYFMDPWKTPEINAFVEERSGYPAESLRPALSTTFDRITLVSKAMTERLTIDLNLRFHNYRNDAEENLGNVVIIEIKQDGFAHSDLADILFDLRIKPMGMSKYCIGTAMTDPDAKQNRFKVRIRKIKTLI